MRPFLTVVGAGGHAKVVITSARAAGFRDLRVVDHRAARWGESILGVRIVDGADEVLADAEALAVLAVGDNRSRHRLGASARCRFASIVHPSAVVDPTVTIGAGTVVFAGAVVQPDSRLGSHTIVNTGASIDHDCTLDTAVHVAPGARLAGNVRVGERTLIGIGAAVIPGIVIGRDAVVGAGAAVVRDVPSELTVIGVPARARL